ncbi:MAG TPA: flavoprotein, partial [Chthoniobacterales bacterium]|nr:flavoprotein [Chthoniobacterales bacterium]
MAGFSSPQISQAESFVKLVIASTGASGAIYLQRLLDQIDCTQHEVHLVLSAFGKQVIHDE